ncbi:MAG: hypothetical protein K6A94_09380 [Bacteroidales bacterium]|jgi:hypothetical protein|nr:hypothetical protein [Bacteroidales bacterium]
MKTSILKTMMTALLLTIAVPFVNAQVHVGDILCQGNLIYSPSIYPSSGATAIGVVFYVDNTGQHGWAVALQDAGSYQWGSSGSDTPLPNYINTRQAIYDLDGYNNTLIVRQHSTDHPAFYAVDFANGWYVPAIGQLNYLYGNLVEVNASLQVAGGTAFDNGDWRYWSSTEYSSLIAWYLYSSGELYSYYGNGSYSKYASWRVRGVRAF